jgi:hypothetical protein
VEQYILAVCQLRLVGNDETIALADIEPLDATTDPDGGFTSVFKAVTGHRPLKHYRPLFPKTELSPQILFLSVTRRQSPFQLVTLRGLTFSRFAHASRTGAWVPGLDYGPLALQLTRTILRGAPAITAIQSKG